MGLSASTTHTKKISSTIIVLLSFLQQEWYVVQFNQKMLTWKELMEEPPQQNQLERLLRPMGRISAYDKE